MKHVHFFLTLSVCLYVVACSGSDSKTGAHHSAEDLLKSPSAKITHEDGWTIVSKMENGDRVYWFLAPEVDDVSPAMYKKIVYIRNKGELETRTVSQCDAPKQVCDDLMKEFKVLSKKYQ